MAQSTTADPTGIGTAPTTIQDMNGFVHSLPQEIKDIIFDWTFTAPSGPFDLTNISRAEKHKSFKFLHISSEARDKYAKSYYSREFTFRANLFMWSIPDLVKWVNSIPPQHQQYLTQITLIRLNNDNLSSQAYLDWVIRSCRRDITTRLGAQIDAKVVYQLAAGPLNFDDSDSDSDGDSHHSDSDAE